MITKLASFIQTRIHYAQVVDKVTDGFMIRVPFHGLMRCSGLEYLDSRIVSGFVSDLSKMFPVYGITHDLEAIYVRVGSGSDNTYSFRGLIMGESDLAYAKVLGACILEVFGKYPGSSGITVPIYASGLDSYRMISWYVAMYFTGGVPVIRSFHDGHGLSSFSRTGLGGLHIDLAWTGDDGGGQWWYGGDLVDTAVPVRVNRNTLFDSVVGRMSGLGMVELEKVNSLIEEFQHAEGWESKGKQRLKSREPDF